MGAEPHLTETSVEDRIGDPDMLAGHLNAYVRLGVADEPKAGEDGMCASYVEAREAPLRIGAFIGIRLILLPGHSRHGDWVFRFTFGAPLQSSVITRFQHHAVAGLDEFLHGDELGVGADCVLVAQQRCR